MVPLIALAARFGVPEPLRRAFAWAAIVITALALLGLAALAISAAVRRHDRGVVTADRTEANAKASGTVLQAERAAGATKDARDRAFAQQQQQLQEKTDAAARNSDSPLDALFDGLR